MSILGLVAGLFILAILVACAEFIIGAIIVLFGLCLAIGIIVALAEAFPTAMGALDCAAIFIGLPAFGLIVQRRRNIRNMGRDWPSPQSWTK